MIELLKGFPDNVVAIRAGGRIKKEDYETVLIPAVGEALKTHPKVRVYYEVGPDFAGFEAGAVWDDFSFGLGNIGRWEKVAVVTDVEWLRNVTGAFHFLMPCVVQVFPVSEVENAKAWVVAKPTEV